MLLMLRCSCRGAKRAVRGAGRRENGGLEPSPANVKRLNGKEAELQRRIAAAVQQPHHAVVLAL